VVERASETRDPETIRGLCAVYNSLPGRRDPALEEKVGQICKHLKSAQNRSQSNSSKPPEIPLGARLRLDLNLRARQKLEEMAQGPPLSWQEEALLVSELAKLRSE
jgi:hypothetical protein